MRIVILGSGVIGVTSAYYLARAGHDVTVIDRQPGPALETSFANAGQISPGYASPWAAPGIPLKAVKWMMQRHAPLSISLDGSLSQLKWMWQMLRNCTPEAYAVNKERMVRLAEYSRDCFKVLRAEAGITYEGRQQGTMQLFRTEKQYNDAAKDIDVLRDAGVPFEVLQRDQCRAPNLPWKVSRTNCLAACACPTTKPATASCLPPAWPTWPSTWACSSAMAYRSTRC